jgi:hypothetical protein
MQTQIEGLRIGTLGNIVPVVFTPVLAKHSKSFSLIDCIAVGVDRMQRNFEPMRKQLEAWQRREVADVTAKVVIYEAFVKGKLEAPKHLARRPHGPGRTARQYRAACARLGGAKIAAAGCALGLFGSLAVARLLRAFLFGVSATNPIVYTASICLMRASSAARNALAVF